MCQMRDKIKAGAVLLTLGFCFLMLAAQSSATVWPISCSWNDFADTPTSPFGIRYLSTDKPYDHHEGLDIQAYYDPVYSIEDATIYEMKLNDGAAGNWVLVEHWYPDMSLYMHLDSWCSDLEAGWEVMEGEEIATSGWSGMSYESQAHLHLGFIGCDEYDNVIGLAGPRWNPVDILPYYDATCPDVYEDYFTVEYDYYSGAIDYLEFSTYTPSDEMDFAEIDFWLYSSYDYHRSDIFVEDYYHRSDNNADNAQFDGYFDFDYGDSYYELFVYASPRNYTAGDNYHIIDWCVDPSNNESFVSDDWIGVTAHDVTYACDYFYSSNWGNTTGLSPKVVISRFWADCSENCVRIHWNGDEYGDLAGMHILRSRDSLENFERISNEPLSIEGEDNTFVDENVPEGGKYFYRYELLYSDGHAVKSSEYASVDFMQPAEFRLSQNYPNPFNMSTRIDYALTEKDAGPVRLDIIDILGRRVRTLIDEKQEPGVYTVLWDGCDSEGSVVGTGIYFYKLTTAESKASRKMMVIK